MIHKIKDFSELIEFKDYEKLEFIDLEEGDFEGLKEKLFFDGKDRCIHPFSHKYELGHTICHGISCWIWGGSLNYSWKTKSGFYTHYRRDDRLFREYIIKIEQGKPLLVSPDGSLERWLDYDKWLELRAFM